MTIDEAHTFPTLELNKIITQGRHNKLYARIAHQHLDQFDPKISSMLRNGCGSLCIFAVGTKDGEVLVDDLEPMYRDRTLDSLRSLEKGQAVLRLTEGGSPKPPVSSPITIDQVQRGSAKPSSAIKQSRQRFGTPRLQAEFQIAWSRSTLSEPERAIWRSKLRNDARRRGAGWCPDHDLTDTQS